MKLKAPNVDAIEVELAALYHGQAFIKINSGGDYLMLVAPREEMIAELKRLLRTFETRTLEQATAAAALPIELYQAETAWPFLLERFPWLFNDIDTGREPYSNYLASKTHQRASCAVCGQSVMSVTAKYCSAACRQAAYRERKAVA